MGVRLSRNASNLAYRYAIALAITAVCFGLRFALQPILSVHAPFATFYLGTVLTVHWLGPKPALLTSGLGALLTTWFFIQPVRSHVIENASAVAWVGFYIFVSLSIIYAAARQQRAEARATASAELAERRFRDLLAETKAREEAQKAEERQRRWAEVTLTSIGDAVISTDAAGAVTFLNKPAEELTGWSASEATGKPISAIFRIVNESTREPVEIPVEKVLRTGTIQGLANHTILIAKGGSEVPIDDSAAPIRDGGGELLGVVLVFRDVAKQKQQEQELRRSNEDLARFAYVASHDLQQPIRMVASFMGLLQTRYADKLDQQAHEYIQFAIDGAIRMQNMVRDLLEYSGAGAGKLHLTEVDLNRIVGNVTLVLRDTIAETQATVRCGTLPVIAADEVKLTRVLQNLIGNALKFRRETPPEIDVTAEARGTQWLLRVRDNGIGFEPQYCDRVFNMFERLTGDARYQGNGIGLAVCKRIVEMHGGRIWAESAPGKGSIFSFTLPAESTAERGRKATANNETV